jgi:hypothetical protein
MVCRYTEPVPRRLLNLVTALSLLLCLSLVALWLRSYAPRDFTFGFDNGNVLFVFTDGAWTSIARGKESFTLSFGEIWRMAQSQASGHGSLLGVSYVSRPTQTPPGAGFGGSPGRFLMLAVPFVYPAALAAAATAWALLARARLARRSRLGACRKCGYDLRGNASGVCPECGTPAATGP